MPFKAKSLNILSTMGDRLKYERFLWFHGRVKNNKYPNSRHLCEVSRIKSAEPHTRKLQLPAALPSVKEYIRKNFGIMQGGKQSIVKLKFSPAVSGWVREQVWHPGQKTTLCKDGSLILQFPVADFKEIRRRILSYGADLKVLSPKALALDLKDEIKKMGKIY